MDSEKYISKPKKEKVELKCLTCGNKFMSRDKKNNRMCKNCIDHAGGYAGEGSTGKWIGAKEY